ncbi:MAG: TonB-dependent receptor [Bacteroidetes bacterium]|nr:TonB-dependent receptor [Bacteroidota bacterium]
MKTMKINKFLTLLIPILLCAFNTNAQSVTLTGKIVDSKSKEMLAYAGVILKTQPDSVFVSGTISDSNGIFSLININPGRYFIYVEYAGFSPLKREVFVGSKSQYLNVGELFLEPNDAILGAVEVGGKKGEVAARMDKKTYDLKDNISQSGGSVTQAVQNLPGISIQDGKILLRGNSNVIILIDGKQTAITGFGGQGGLDNIPASSVERIEIINNPSSKFDANGNAGIINIILKKEKNDGLHVKGSMGGGVGAWWVRHGNLPDIRPQYTMTPKINPSVSLNYRKDKVNVFFNADDLYTHSLNKNEFTTRYYDDGTLIRQQLKRNRNTNFVTSRIGLDYNPNAQNSFVISGMFGSEKILDRGDEPFFSGNLEERFRLWQFLEDELKTTAMATAVWRHNFKEAGHHVEFSYNYTFHRENERYYFKNTMPTFIGNDSFKLLSDQKVSDFMLDYFRPTKHGKFESGLKFRKRAIPTNMHFQPGLNSPLDVNAGGKATYEEVIPAAYANYVFEKPTYEMEAGLRVEYVSVNYLVNPNHNTYKSDGYNYLQPFPFLRLAKKLGENKKLTLFLNRRVDRPQEVDIRIFPKYDDAEIIKVGNPALKPQFTNSAELGYKSSWDKGYLFLSLYGKQVNGTITRISSTVPGSTLIYAIFQNVNSSINSGIEMVFEQKISKKTSVNLNGNIYYNQIDSFSVHNLYPTPNDFHADQQQIYSGNLKCNIKTTLGKSTEMQVTFIYLAPDIIPQGTISSRYAVNLGLKKMVSSGKGEWYINVSDLFNTMIVRKTIQGDGFYYTISDYQETQSLRFGYKYTFR